MSARKKERIDLLKFAGSVRLAFALFIIIIMVSFAGAVIPEQYRTNVYHSWWFITLLFVFAANLLACVLVRVTAGRRNLGSIFTHAAVLVILAGALASFLGSQRGYIQFVAGGSADHFVSERGLVKLPFSLAMEKFETEWYPVTKYKISFFVRDKKIKRSLDLALGKEYDIPGTGYRIKAADYFPDFYLDENNIPLNGSSRPRNPALRLVIASSGASEERWVFSNHPSMAMGKDQNIKVVFDSEPMVKEYRSFLTVVDGEHSEAVIIRVNHPFSRKGFSVYQSGSPEEPALEVVRDPGTAVVFAGFLLLNAGIIMIYALRLRPAGEKR